MENNSLAYVGYVKELYRRGLALINQDVKDARWERESKQWEKEKGVGPVAIGYSLGPDTVGSIELQGASMKWKYVSVSSMREKPPFDSAVFEVNVYVPLDSARQGFWRGMDELTRFFNQAGLANLLSGHSCSTDIVTIEDKYGSHLRYTIHIRATPGDETV